MINIRNEGRDEVVYATVRMSKLKYESLREFVHTKKGAEVEFHIQGKPTTRLIKQGYGWYRLVAINDYRATDKIKSAIKVLMIAARNFKRELVAELQRLQRGIAGVSTTVAAVASHTGVPAYVEVAPGSILIEKPKPRGSHSLKPSPVKLNQLLARFSKNQQAQA